MSIFDDKLMNRVATQNMSSPSENPLRNALTGINLTEWELMPITVSK
jgi:hypothetical protein